MDALGMVTKLAHKNSKYQFVDVTSVLNWNIKHTDAIEKQFVQLGEYSSYVIILKSYGNYFKKFLYKSTIALWSPAITETPIIRTATKSHAKINYRCLSKINSHYYGLSLIKSTVTNQSSLQRPI